MNIDNKKEIIASLVEFVKPFFQTAFDIVDDYTSVFGITITLGVAFIMWLIVATTIGTGKKVGFEPTKEDNASKEEEQKKEQEEKKKKEKQEREQQEELELLEEQKRQAEQEEELEKEEKTKQEEERLEIQKSEEEKKKDIEKQEKLSDEQRQEIKNYRQEKKQNITLDFDWNKKEMKGVDDKKSDLNLNKTKQAKTNLSELLNELVLLMEKGFANKQIAQELSSQAKKSKSYEQIIQTIEAVRSFVEQTKEKLGDKAQKNISAIKSGNLEIAIEFFLDEFSKEQNFSKASKIASYVGALALFDNNQNLAIEAFEKAVEMAPSNVGAWSNLGDIHLCLANGFSAEQSYAKVLSYGNKEKHTFQMGKAFEKLAYIQEIKGNKENAQRLSEQSKNYFEKIGVKTSLNPKEKEALLYIKNSNQFNKTQEEQKEIDYIKLAELENFEELENTGTI